MRLVRTHARVRVTSKNRVSPANHSAASAPIRSSRRAEASAASGVRARGSGLKRGSFSSKRDQTLSVLRRSVA